MDSNSEDGDYQSVEQQDAAQYRVTYPHGRNTKEVSWVTHYNTQMYLCMLVIIVQNVFFYAGGLQ